MKTNIIFLFLFICFSHSIYGQKLGYIDSNFIINKMPAYKEAKAQVDKLAKEWQTELEKLKLDIETANANFKAEEILLSDQMRQERVTDIAKMNQLYAETNRKYFGFEGLLFLKRQELIKPVQDKIYDAVEKVCKGRRIDFMIDKSSDLVLIYTNPVHDYTEYVLEELGLGDENEPTGKK